MSLHVPSYGGPASFPQKNCSADNSITQQTMGMPQKFAVADGTTSFSQGRNKYLNAPMCSGLIFSNNNKSVLRVDTSATNGKCNTAVANTDWSHSSVRVGHGQHTRITVQNGKKTEVSSSDQYIQRKKNRAIGRGSTNNPAQTFSFSENSNTNINNRNSALAKCRGGGCVAPPKKGGPLMTANGPKAQPNPFKSGGSCC